MKLGLEIAGDAVFVGSGFQWYHLAMALSRGIDITCRWEGQLSSFTVSLTSFHFAHLAPGCPWCSPHHFVTDHQMFILVSSLSAIPGSSLFIISVWPHGNLDNLRVGRAIQVRVKMPGRSGWWGRSSLMNPSTRLCVNLDNLEAMTMSNQYMGVCRAGLGTCRAITVEAGDGWVGPWTDSPYHTCGVGACFCSTFQSKCSIWVPKYFSLAAAAVVDDFDTELHQFVSPLFLYFFYLIELSPLETNSAVNFLYTNLRSKSKVDNSIQTLMHT